MSKIYNFSAGPSMLPKEVLQHVKRELYNWNNCGVSIMEISHRSDIFLNFIDEIREDIRNILHIPKNYQILFCQGGARGQFSALPLNLFKETEIVEYLYSGYWSKYALQEALKYCIVKEINILSQNNDLMSLRPIQECSLSDDIKYLHYCSNETVEGINVDLDFSFLNKKDVIVDATSDIFSKPLNLNLFGVVYASSQKNIGIPGLTLVIIREDLLGRSRENIPSIMNYTILNHYHSLYNTPVTFSLYISGLILKWLQKQGGLQVIKIMNAKKAALLYDFIDNSEFYINNIDHLYRSCMNITFFIKKSYLSHDFLHQSRKNGFLFLEGHKSIGGFRASIYNAMPIIGVKKLIKFMKDFEYYNK
uniref:Phosphoserine aminotransferase n=1 Tax=Candidatus Aschnera chinzeii TaxID=1485666 RepID=A0AAT9G3W8_9ENTR|nr:MAG: 3-phosphoserine/phosphohydroxythreonine transaminase [Candidatus Aschnera chinzeii]